MSVGWCVDTSVVLRLLVGEPVDQYLVAAAFLKEQLNAGATVTVPDLVLAEAYFALQNYYEMPKEKALAAPLFWSRTVV